MVTPEPEFPGGTCLIGNWDLANLLLENIHGKSIKKGENSLEKRITTF